LNQSDTNTEHFPVDPDAPKLSGSGNFLANKNIFGEIVLFALISLITAITITFSVYIIIVKFF